MRQDCTSYAGLGPEQCPVPNRRGYVLYGPSSSRPVPVTEVVFPWLKTPPDSAKQLLLDTQIHLLDIGRRRIIAAV